MGSIADKAELNFQTDDFFNYPTFLPDLLFGRSNGVSTRHMPILEKKDAEYGNYTVTFSPDTENYCVGMVDMVDSTKISTMLRTDKMSRYYQIFLNSMSKIIRKFDGKVVKNIGDCLMYYFPSRMIENQEKYLIKCLECNFAMVESHGFIYEQLKKENLPCLNYRISMDYGNVILMRTSDSTSVDMIGTPINVCSKINHSAPPNGIVVGGDIHEMIKKAHIYEFKEILHPIGEYSIKHGEEILIYNVYGKSFGNKIAPKKNKVKKEIASNNPLHLQPNFEFNRVELNLDITNSKTMMTHHTWIWNVRNTTSEPLQQVFYDLGAT